MNPREAGKRKSEGTVDDDRDDMLADLDAWLNKDPTTAGDDDDDD